MMREMDPDGAGFIGPKGFNDRLQLARRDERRWSTSLRRGPDESVVSVGSESDAQASSGGSDAVEAAVKIARNMLADATAFSVLRRGTGTMQSRCVQMATRYSTVQAPARAALFWALALASMDQTGETQERAAY